MREALLEIRGMSCGHCVAGVRRALEQVDGVVVGEVAIGSARVTFDPAATSLERLVEAVREEGYAARPAEERT